MIRRLAALAIFAATLPAAAPAGHICWVEQVEMEGSGVRIRLGLSAPVRPEERSVHLDPGGTLSPATSGHDGCTISVARRGGKLGVLAQAHFFAYGIMTQPELRTEWIPAEASRRDKRAR